MRDLRQGLLQKAREEVAALLDDNAALAAQLAKLRARSGTGAISGHAAGPWAEMLDAALQANRSLAARLETYEVCGHACCRVHYLL